MPGFAFLVMLAAIALLAPARAQAQGYTGIVLYRLQFPAGFPQLFVLPDDGLVPESIGGQKHAHGQVVGSATQNGGSALRHAFLWSTPLGTAVDLNPAGFDNSAGFAMSGTQQVGWARNGTADPHAFLWSGTAASAVDLHPASGFLNSYAIGVGGGQQVGYGQVLNDPQGLFHAFLWSGTNASRVDLQPLTGFLASLAQSTNGSQQVGFGDSSVLDGGRHALLWSGTAASVVDLHPATVYRYTHALGIGDGQQVGFGNDNSQSGGGPARALLWKGTAASMVELHPTNLGPNADSIAIAVRGGTQVGWARTFPQAGQGHAYVWSGTAASAVDLHPLLPGGPFDASFATTIDANGNIFGIAAIYSTFPQQFYAVEWSPMPAKLANISTRLKVLTGANVLIGGFIVSGSGNQNILLRALGPTLTPFGITDALANPTLELHNGSGAIITSNDNWKDTQQSEIAATGKPPPNDLESAILHSYAPGNYTAIVQGVNQTTGTALVEAYDLDAGTAIQLSNISTRGFVSTGNAVMIGGFIVDGPPGSFIRVVIRALGPTLTQFHVPGALQDPTLALHDEMGATIVSNDNWKETQQSDLQATNLAPPDDRESAIVVALPPGNYTAIESGKNHTTGVGLVEVYKAP